MSNFIIFSLSENQYLKFKDSEVITNYVVADKQKDEYLINVEDINKIQFLALTGIIEDNSAIRFIQLNNKDTHCIFNVTTYIINNQLKCDISIIENQIDIYNQYNNLTFNNMYDILFKID